MSTHDSNLQYFLIEIGIGCRLRFITFSAVLLLALSAVLLRAYVSEWFAASLTYTVKSISAVLMEFLSESSVVTMRETVELFLAFFQLCSSFGKGI
ncbi:hypothetical protein AB6A40_000968 [Gnathostoma spinigerum]|uniref:Uncharacterized protein n=1 Tax=Gnathostoma spinigerum TaxID=75299 RepID=A0ABD6E7W6_9BILA